MPSKSEKKKELQRLSKESRVKADEFLAEDLEKLIKMSTTNLEKLKPMVTDKKAYEALIKVVQESTQKNEDLAKFRERIEQLGKGVVAATKEAVKLIA